MTRIRLVSFDLWSTLAVGSQAYRRRRAELVAGAFGRAEPDAVAAAIADADAELDDLTDRTGRQHGFTERVRRTGQLLGAAELTDERLDGLRAAMGQLFASHPPTLTEPTVPQTLAGLRRLGIRVAVTSNTGYVPGLILRPMLDRLGILRLTDHLVFSDEVGCAKPSRRIYQHLAAVAGGRPSETLHIGDNRKADYHGARAAGLHALWYRPGGPAGPGVLRRHLDLLDHPLVRADALMRPPPGPGRPASGPEPPGPAPRPA